MSEDIFGFWASTRINRTDRIHPADAAMLQDYNRGKLDLNALPGCFMGPLKQARVVFLDKAPGVSRENSDDPNYQEFLERTRAGNEALPSKEAWPGWWEYWTSYARRLSENLTSLQTRLAFLNAAAYHKVADKEHDKLIAKLPSSKNAMSWAQEHVIAKAKSRELVTICLRPATWGLTEGVFGSLFVLKSVRKGMAKGEVRDEAIEAAKKMLIG